MNGGQKWTPSLKSVAYPAMMKLGSCSSPKEGPKIYRNHVTHRLLTSEFFHQKPAATFVIARIQI